jgi:energy-coupling factor transporter ATP-binding protein EcfA2
MKLDEIKLTNFRGYAVETPIPIDHLTVLVGRNDAGKSTILEALDVFFNEEVIEREDCCVHTGSTEIRIACVFSDLPDSLVIDDQYATTLGAERLLRTDGKLEIIKVYDCGAAKGKFIGAYAKALHPSAAEVDELLSLKLTELKTKAKQLGIDLSGVNQAAKAPIRQAIWDASQNLLLTEREVSLKKESAKDAFDQIQQYMPLYALFKSDRARTDQDGLGLYWLGQT